MRKEATLEQWKKLYELAGRLKEAEPWNMFWDMDLVEIHPEDEEEPVYCSVMGRAGTCLGISVYEGAQGLADFQMASEADEMGLPVDYVMYEQSSLVGYWGDREEVPREQKQVIKDLNLKFRGRGQWPYFLSYRKRFAPYTPDRRETEVLIESFEGLLAVIRDLASGFISVDWDGGEIASHFRDPDNGEWRTVAVDRPRVEVEYPVLELKDEVLMRRLRKMKYVNADIMLDFAYMNANIMEKGDERPRNPLLFVALDVDNDMVIDLHLLQNEEEESEVAIGFFIQFLQDYGKMQVIRARNPWILAALENICTECGVSLIEDSLEPVDAMLADLRERIL